MKDVTGITQTIKAFFAALVVVLASFVVASTIIIKETEGIEIVTTDPMLLIGGFLAGAGLTALAILLKE